MSRLPQPGSDDGTWGAILNDYLNVSHASDGTLKQVALTTAGAEQTANKGAANGYASLGVDGKVPVAQLPTMPGVGDYMGVYANGLAIDNNNFSGIAWSDTSVINGDSLAFDSGDPQRVQVVETGVYSITVTIDWEDMTVPGVRMVQLITECQFYVEDQRPSTNDAALQTIQSVTATLYLQAGDDIYIYLNQTNAGSAQLNPFARMLVTRCA